MPRYRKKPVEVEAWQVGSDEPMPKWVRKCGASHYIFPRQWFVRDKKGRVYIESEDTFEQTYEVVE